MERNQELEMNIDTSQMDRQVLAKCLKERLKWFTFEAGAEEFDSEEVTAIVNLLNVLDPMKDAEHYSAEKALERFWKYYEQRMYEESVLINKTAEEGIFPAEYETTVFETLESMLIRPETKEFEQFESAEYDMAGAVSQDVELAEFDPVGYEHAGSELAEPEPETGSSKVGKVISVTQPKGEKGKRHFIHGKHLLSGMQFFRTHKAITSVSAAAVLLVLVFAVLNVGVLAEQEMGFFYWLRKDDSKTEFMTNGNMGMGTESNASSQYEIIDDVPEQYRERLWIPMISELPEGMEFLCVEVGKTDDFTKVVEKYSIPESKQELQIGSVIFYNRFSFLLVFEGFKYIGERKIDNISMDLYFAEFDDKTNNAACFYNGNVQYFVIGNMELEEIISIAENFAQEILSK